MSVVMGLGSRKARMEDADLLWRWANDPETRRNSFNKSPIPYAEHLVWLEGRLWSAATCFWLFTDEGRPVGQVRCEMTGPLAEIDISVAPESRGRGYGRAMLVEALRLLRAEHGSRLRARASVLAHNARSLALFRACGFRETGMVEGAGGERIITFELDASAKGGEDGDDG